jgi:hypothetical protein
MIIAADELIHEGRLPERGSVGSTFGHTPPGIAWFLTPGLMLFNDPRMFQVPAAGGLFVLTLIGIVLLGRALLNETCGWIAAALYTFSGIGIFFASSLWPRGHPFFVVWTLYFCYLAIEKSRKAWLLVAAIVYVVGVFEFLEVAPLGIVFLPTLALNRKLFAWWVVPSILLFSVLVFMPYLRFESQVNFVDLKRMITNNSRIPGEPQLCREDVDIRTAVDDKPVDIMELDYRFPPPPNGSFLERILAHRVPMVVRAVFWNTYDVSSREGVARNVGLSSLWMLGLAFSYAGMIKTQTRPKAHWLGNYSFAMICGAILTLLSLKLIASRYPDIDWLALDNLLLFGLLSVAIGLSIARWLFAKQLAMLSGRRWPSQSKTVAVLLLCTFVVGQLAWTLTSAPESRRFLWLWPIQCLYIALALSECCRWVEPLKLRPAWAATPIICFLAIPQSVRPLENWNRVGWSGDDEPVIKLLDQLAYHRKTTAKGSQPVNVSVSYDIHMYPFNLVFNSVDRRYRLGMGYDLYLKHKHSLRQELLCANSYSLDSQYVIKQGRPSLPYDNVPPQTRLKYHSTPKNNDGYVVLGKEGNFSLLWRP